ncbi:C4-dicarboxylate transporter DctA [Klebsiella grimontii]
MKISFFKSLYVQVLSAIAIGILLGHFYPELGAQMKPLGDAFVKLIKMIIAPVIFCTVVTGIAGMESMKAVGRTGAVALLYFEIVSTIALIIGLIIVNVVQPGAGMNVDPATLDAKAVAVYAEQAKDQGIVAFLLDIIPGSVIGAFASGNILQVLMFAVLFGFALHRLGSKGQLIFNVIESFSQVIFGIINMIMRLAPIGAFGAMAFTIGKYGVGTLVQLGQLIVCFYITCILFVVVVLGSIAKATGFSIFKFIRYIREELLIVLGTSSSESALPRMLDKMEKLGCRKSVVGLVIPTGYSFNLDGTSIYLTMAAVFIAQATNSHMDIFHQITLLVVLLLSSKGAAGVTGSGFIVLAATISAVGHLPVAGLALILGIDRFMSEARALTNLVGNGVATIVVAKWVKELDSQQLDDVLNNRTPVNTWSGDIGTTPMGFNVVDVVGGLSYSSDVGPLGYTVNLHRRPISSSLLAFGGQKDNPNDGHTGKTWGGVRADGGGVSLSYDKGEANGVWSSLGVDQLTGKNVADNWRVRWMTGYYYKVVNEDNRRVTVGLNNMLWHYDKDLSGYTLGQGGYYSPQEYVSFSVPVTWRQRTENWSWELGGSVSWSHSRTKTEARYPLLNLLPSQYRHDASQLTEEGSSSSGVGYTARALIERRVTSNWFVGAAVDIQQAKDYTPSHALLYVRYSASGWQGDMDMPPQPLVPYADW